ncbi:MAG: 4-(cytidine 5'-diphospho)-2-C-methyl-D-erythritol kinase [Brevinematia bacterium]
MKYNLLTSAKINLGLTVIGKLPDGYHEIESIIIPIGIFDKLECKFYLKEKTKNLKINLNPRVFSKNVEIPNDKENTIWKIVNFVEETLGINIGFDINVQKNIPIGGGLGGSSSNAGGVLLSLIDFLEKNKIINRKSKKYIISNAHLVGSDIPFFLSRGGCIVQGKGEKITPINKLIKRFSKTLLVVVYPNLCSSTKKAYEFISNNKLYSTERWAFKIAKELIQNELKMQDLKEMLKNIFELFIISPVVEIKNELYSRGAMFASMSGSGSCVYGIFESRLDTQNIRNEINKLDKDYKIFVTRFVENPVIFI